MNQKNPWGRLNPERGKKFLPLAAAFRKAFAERREPIPLDDIDAFLIKQRAMAADSSRAERGVARHKYLDRLRAASTSQHMRDIGLEPFQVDATSRLEHWEVISLGEHIRRRKEARKLRSQGRTSSLKLRQMLQALEHSPDQKGFLYCTMSVKVLDITNTVLHTLDEQLAKGLTDMAVIFDRTEGLLGGSDSAVAD
jgi:hypothetical protein